MGWLTYNFRDSVHYHHDGEFGSVQADVVLELRVLHFAGSRKPSETLGGILSTGDLKTCPYNDTLPPTPYLLPGEPRLLIVPLPMILWEPITSKQTQMKKSK